MTHSRSAAPRRATLAAGLLLAFPAFGQDGLADGGYRVTLEDAAGQGIEIARVTVSDGTYSVAMTPAPFTEHFLSMRPFRCLEGADKHWCHVPYPYAIARDLRAGAVDLEYDFLFLWKNATDYGINMWNGVYYVLGPGPGGLTGQMHEIDMDILSAPPGPGEMRPIGADDLHAADPDSHWLPVLRIVRD